MVKNLRVMIGAILVMGVVLASASWAVPMLINIQGRITPYPTGADEMYFRFYDREIGGTRLSGIGDMAYVSEVMNSDGIFNANLEVNNEAIFNLHDNIWVEIEVERAGVFSPRQRLVSVPFAITARNVRGGNISAFRLAAETDSNAAAVLGTNLRSAGASNPLILNPGVAGMSTAGYGVIGWVGNAAKAGVYGLNANTSLVLQNGPGVAGSGRPGVYGLSDSGYGVNGQSTRDIGVHGVGPAAGVYGESVNGYGVIGTSANSCGGSFEADSKSAVIAFSNTNMVGQAAVKAIAPRGNAIRAETSSSVFSAIHAENTGTGNSGSGLYAKTSSNNVNDAAIRAIAEEGARAIYASNDSAANSAIYTKNDSGGPALELGEGSMKAATENDWVTLIDSRDPFDPAAASRCYSGIGASMNKVVGTITVANDVAAGRRVFFSVSNRYVTEDSQIFLSYRSKDDDAIVSLKELQIREQNVGSFIIQTGGAFRRGDKINFLIIN